MSRDVMGDSCWEEAEVWFWFAQDFKKSILKLNHEGAAKLAFACTFRQHLKKKY